MPQLDRIIIFPQIFWFFIIFVFSYIILLHFFLPKFLISFKLRKYILELNSNLINNIIVEINKDQLHTLTNLTINLKKIKDSFYLNTYKVNALIFNSTLTNATQSNNYIIKIVYNNILFCNKQILNSIKLYPSAFNLKKS